MSTKTAETLDQKLDQLINGVQTTLTSGQSFIIDGQSYDQASLLTALKAEVEPFVAADSAHEVLKMAVADREAARPGALAFYKAVASVLLGSYGSNTTSLATFGLAPRKAKRQLTSEEQLKATAKANATRALRGTIGPKKKEGIKATGPVTITSTLGSSAPVAVSQPRTPGTPAAVPPANGADPNNGVANGASH